MVYDVSMLVRTQILFPEDILAYIREEARRRKSSVSALVRSVVADKVAKRKKKKISATEALLRMAERANHYRGPKAPRDLSTNDDYLYTLP